MNSLGLIVYQAFIACKGDLLDALLVWGVDAIIDEHRLPRALEAELTAAIGREAVFDLVATVGFYSVLGAILMTYDVPLDHSIAVQMELHPLGV